MGEYVWFPRLVNFYKRKEIGYYNPEITLEYVGFIVSRYQEKKYNISTIRQSNGQ